MDSSMHLLRFYSGAMMPTLLARENGSEKEGATAIELPAGMDAEIGFSPRHACIGYRTPKNHWPCPNHAINVRQCPSCGYLDVAKAYTVGDFSVYPALYEEAKNEEYVLYLAGFGEDIVKCGVTRKERFSERMREQGADFGCIVASYMGPDRIYGAETALQARFSFANAVRMSEKISRLVFDHSSARDNFATAVETVSGSGVLDGFSPQILDFAQYYPSFQKQPSRGEFVSGKISGAKGELLFFKPSYAGGGRDCCVNMRNKVGHFFGQEIL